MKYVKSLCIFLCLILLSSCVGQRELDVNEFIKKANASVEILPSAENFNIYREDKAYRHSAMINENMILNFYSLSDGKIQRITLTTDAPDKEYDKLCSVLLETMCDLTVQEAEKILSNAENSVNVKFGIYCIAIIKSDIGETFLISYADDEINSNNCPTLKKHINDEDVTRPTAAVEEKTK